MIELYQHKVHEFLFINVFFFFLTIH